MLNFNGIRRGQLLALAMAATLAAPASADDVQRPNPELTPGAVASTDVHSLCFDNWRDAENDDAARIKAGNDAYQAYNIQHDSKTYEINHLIPLSWGGSAKRENLWPMRRVSPPYDAAAKERLAWRGYQEICHGKWDLEASQKEIATDWVAMYDRVCKEASDCPAFPAKYRAP